MDKKRLILQTKEITFTELMIDSDVEQPDVTKNYLKQIKKIDIELAGGKDNFREYHR